MKRILKVTIAVVLLTVGILVGSFIPSVYAGGGGAPLYINVSSNGINIHGENRSDGWHLTVNGDQLTQVFVNGQCVYPIQCK